MAIMGNLDRTILRTWREDDGSAGGARVRQLRRHRTRSGSNQEVTTAVYLLMVLTAGAYIPSPLYPSYEHAFGFNDLMLTAIFAAFAVAACPALLLLGPSYDTWGPRPLLRASLLLAAGGAGCFLFASGPGWLLAARGLQGLALAAVTAAATTVIIDRSRLARRNQASLLASIAFVGGTAAGPLGAGLLAEYIPAPFTVPYLVLLVLVGYGWIRTNRLRPVRPSHGKARSWRPTHPHVPRGMRAVFAAGAASGFLGWTVAGIFLVLIPAVLPRAAGTGNRAVIGLVVCVVLLCSAVAQLTLTRMPPSRAQKLGTVALVISLCLLAPTGGGGTLSLLLTAAVLAGVGHGLAYAGASAMVEAAVPDEYRGGVTAALYLVFYLGTAVPTVVVGLLTLAHPLATAISWLSCLGIAFGTLSFAAVLIIRAPSVEKQPASAQHDSALS